MVALGGFGNGDLQLAGELLEVVVFLVAAAVVVDEGQVADAGRTA